MVIRAKRREITKELSLLTDDEIKILGDRQWVLLNALENAYVGKTVYGTHSTFESDVWFSIGNLHNQTKLYWRSQIGVYSTAFSIMIRVVFFELFNTNRLEINSAIHKLVSLRKTLFNLIQKKNLLNGDQGDFCLGLHHISDNELLELVDTVIHPDNTEAAAIMSCSIIGQFISCSNQLSTASPLFEFLAQPPWVKSDKSIKTWVRQRADDLGVTFRIADGYLPFSNETADLLIQKSLSLILEHEEQLFEMAQLIRAYKVGKNYDGPLVTELLEKFAPSFSEFMAPPYIDDLPNTDSKLSKIYIWIRELIYLARGACVNIVLFTSGLRNGDVRNIRIGACNRSKRVDSLYYLRADNQKNKKVLKIPVPLHTKLALNVLEKIKFTESDYAIDALKFTRSTYKPGVNDYEANLMGQESLNRMLRNFASHFDIPFEIPGSTDLYSAHSYRSTVAGWLGSYSNLSVLLVRRLFGYSNDVTPMVYLSKNPGFIQEQKDQKQRAAHETARQMSLATSQGRVAGVKGEQLIRGFKLHESRLKSDPLKSHSLTDKEIHQSFTQIIETRILDGSVCGFMTPFGVRCMRNPSDSTQPPCARKSHKEKTREIAEDILQHINDIAPQHCIGTSCDQALVGPWSETLLETLLWNADLLKQKHGAQFTDQHFREQAVSFIRQYAPPIKKVFKVDVSIDGSITYE